jgi:hypothetical protein
LEIGTHSQNGSDFWGGSIGASRFYNRALSTSEVSQLYSFEASGLAIPIQPPTIISQPALATSGTGGNLHLSWPVASGTFQVQTADSPSGPWTTIAMPTFTNGANAVVTVSPTNQQQYFRLQER